MDVVTKKGKKIKRLEMKSTKASIADILAFIDKLIFKLIFHRNDLKHHRTTIYKLYQFTEASLHVDLAENLTVPVKQSPQQMH